MKLIIAFFKLIRWQNLVIIAITQVLYYYALIHPIHNFHQSVYDPFTGTYFILLVISSLMIAAAGNIINDYFDLNIDEVNKPQKKIIDKHIKRRWAIVFHICLSVMGIAIGFYIDYKTSVFWMGLSNMVCALLLFAYSISLKKKVLVGNVLISLLTAWVILVCFFCYFRSLSCSGCNPAEWISQKHRFLRISFLYAGFAFIISLIREVVKDMEDMEGDARYGCRTIPLAWGVSASKMFVAVWLAVLIGTICIVQFYVLQLGWLWSMLYCLVFIILPLIWLLQKLFKAQTPNDYHLLSSVIKLVMLTGLLSMLFFKLYS